jgi:hypothetical protein
MVWKFEVYRLLAYRRTEALLAEAEWARTVAQASPWRSAAEANSTRGTRTMAEVGTGNSMPPPAAKSLPVAAAR